MNQNLVLHKKRYDVEDVREIIHKVTKGKLLAWTQEEFDAPINRDELNRSIRKAKREGMLGATSVFGGMGTMVWGSFLGVTTITLTIWAGAPLLLVGIPLIALGIGVIRK